MPLKLSIGLARKIGLPDYGSLGAHCHIELELDSALLSRDPVSLGDQARRAYAACAEAVEEALTRHRPADARPCSQGRAAANGRSAHPFTPLLATSKQLEYARQLAAQVPGLEESGLEMIAQEQWGKPVAELSRAEASQVIDDLRQILLENNAPQEMPHSANGRNSDVAGSDDGQDSTHGSPDLG